VQVTTAESDGGEDRGLTGRGVYERERERERERGVRARVEKERERDRKRRLHDSGDIGSLSDRRIGTVFFLCVRACKRERERNEREREREREREKESERDR